MSCNGVFGTIAIPDLALQGAPFSQFSDNDRIDKVYVLLDNSDVKLEPLIENITFERRSLSFMQHRNKGLKENLEWMLTQAEQTEQGRRLQSSDGKEVVKQVKRYLRCVDRFLTLLMLCVHMTSGQPGRGSEIMTMHFPLP
jgi:hypothetical protein